MNQTRFEEHARFAENTTLTEVFQLLALRFIQGTDQSGRSDDRRLDRSERRRVLSGVRQKFTVRTLLLAGFPILENFLYVSFGVQ